MERIVNALVIKQNRSKRAYAVLALWVTTGIALHAQTFTTLFSFDGTDGSEPFAALVQATNGELYGTTFAGGANGQGTVFKIATGRLTAPHSFDGTDGSEPYAALIQATNGDFYGTTFAGGANGQGTVFKMATGTLTALHSFDGADGSKPFAALVHATNGDLYGTTLAGGANGYGTLFKITQTGTFTMLHSFDGTDGAYPDAALIQAANGDIYGTTCGDWCFNSSNNPSPMPGTVFKITPSGTLTTLYSFCSQSACADGFFPAGGLVQATNGDFYGTTIYGGASYEEVTPLISGCYPGCGTVFKITPSGTLTTLYSFCSQSACADGIFPAGELVQATNGDFYGTTLNGGANNAGTIFTITLNGMLTTAYSFCAQSGCTDGDSNYAALVQATDGDLYGTTLSGGANNAGTVFRLSVGLGPFVKTQTTSGKVGAVVKILGTDLTGASSVTFNGTPAAFTVNLTGTAISTTVPAGATTGTVQVVTPSGILSSNVPFRVP